MSATRPAPVGPHEISFGDHWHIAAEDQYGNWADTLVVYGLQYDEQDATLGELAAEIDIHLNPYEDDPYEDIPLPDDRAEWHRNYTPLKTWLRAHVLRLAKGWRSKRLATYLDDHPQVAVEMGFHQDEDGLGRFTASTPNQSRLWEIYHEEFGEAERDLCQFIAEDLVQVARDNGIPAPDDVFEPDDREAESERSEQRLVAEKTQEVWRQAKPFVTDSFYLKRGQNASIHENAFWEQHAYIGMRQDMYANAGQHSFAIDTQRDRTPSASNHRYQLEKLDVDEVRSMLQNTTRALIARARHNNELVGNLTAAIDITKSNPFTGDRDGHEDVILGYKGAEYHYQWATIQIVGHDIPLVLDAAPVERGDSRGELVDELLETATDMLPDIELVMMDREFDSEGVKEACDEHGVYYLNPARKHSSERAMCTRLREAGNKLHISEQEGLGRAGRKRIYVPAQNYELFATDDVDGSDEDDGPDVRQEMMSDFVEIGDTDGLDEDGGFADLLDDMREDEELAGSDEDARAYALFETNHPKLSADSDLQTVRSFIQRYSHRWGIENGYKQIKQFRVRTTSKDPQYRFFNFAFACVLYNVWRLVDLLVKLAIEDEAPSYKPRVDANQFLTVAKEYYGLDPPD